ncbi:MAG: hypothetical protein AABX54_05690 [Nanoarchaeota archaeon]
MKTKEDLERDQLSKNGIEFEKEVRKFLSDKWNIVLEERKVKIGNIFKKFDLVSKDEQFIGDAKYYKNISVPAAKFSTIGEYVWLLEKTPAKRKFLVFGKDIEVPKRWLERFGNLTSVEFYFLDGNKLIDLRSKK